MLSQLELKELKEFFTDMPKNPKELMVSLEKQPELLHFVDQKRLDKFNTAQIFQTIKNNFSTTRIWERSKKPFIKAVAEYLRYADYSPDLTLTRKMIPDLLTMALILERGFVSPIFRVDESMAKLLIKSFGKSIDLWNRLNKQIPYKYLVKYYKLNVMSINYISAKDLTRNMVKHYIDKDLQIPTDLIKQTIDKRDIWTKQMIVKYIKLGYMPSGFLTESYLPDFNIRLVKALSFYVSYGRIDDTEIFTDIDKTYFDLVGLDDKESISNYIVDKILKTPAK